MREEGKNVQATQICDALMLAACFAVTLLLVAPAVALASDTKLGNYEEAPYRDVADIKKVDWGRWTFR